MIFQTVYTFLFIVILCVKGLPFSNRYIYQGVRNLHKPHFPNNPAYRGSVRKIPTMFSDPTSSSMHHRSSRLFNTLNEIGESQADTPASNSVRQYLNDFYQETAQNIDKFGKEVMNSIQQHEKKLDQTIRYEMLKHKFKLGEAKDRLRQALHDKKNLLDKLHSFGWHGKYVGIPYHTMNDEHVIVKKPGVNFVLVSQTDIGVPYSASDPVIQSSAVQQPIVSKVDTFANLQPTLETLVSVDKYAFSTTETTIPTISEPIGTNSTDKEESTTMVASTNFLTVDERSKVVENEVLELIGIENQDVYSSSTVPTETTNNFYEISTTTNSSSINLIYETEVTAEVYSTSLSSAIQTETTINSDTIFPTTDTPFYDTTNIWEIIAENHLTFAAPVLSETTTNLDKELLIGQSSLHNDNTDAEISKSEISSTLPSTVLTEATTDFHTTHPGSGSGSSFTSLATETQTTTEFYLMTPASTIPTETTTNQETKFTTTDTSFYSSIINEETSIKNVSTYLPSIPIETTTNSGEESLIDFAALRSFATDPEITTETISTIPYTFSTKTIPTDSVSTTTDLPFTSWTNEKEITIKGQSTTLDFTDPTETTKNQKTTFRTTNIPFYSSTVDERTTTEDASTFFSSVAAEIENKQNTGEGFSIGDALFRSITTDVGTTEELISTIPSTILNEVTTDFYTSSTMSPLSTNFPTETQLTTDIYSNTLAPIIPTEITTNQETKFTTTGTSFHSSTPNKETSIENVSTYLPSGPIETTTNSGEESLIDFAALRNFSTDPEITTETIPTISYTFPTETTTTDYFTTNSLFTSWTNEKEIMIKGQSMTLASTDPTETTKNQKTTFKITNIPFYSSTVDVKTTTEDVSTLTPSILTETTINAIEESPIERGFFRSITKAAGITADMTSTAPFTVPNENNNNFHESTTTDLPLTSLEIETEVTTEIYLTTPASKILTNEDTTYIINTETSTENTATYHTTFSTDGTMMTDEIPATPQLQIQISRDSDHILSRLASNQEELDDKTLLHLIPIVVGELRKNNLSPEDKETLRQVFGSLWPLMVEESKRNSSKIMNHELAMILYEAGQRISHNGELATDITMNNYRLKSKRHIDTNFKQFQVLRNIENGAVSKLDESEDLGSSLAKKIIGEESKRKPKVVTSVPKSAAQFLALLPETGVSVRFDETDEEEYKSRDEMQDDKEYYVHDVDTEEFSSYDNDEGPNIKELFKLASRHKVRRQGLSNFDPDEEYLY